MILSSIGIGLMNEKIVAPGQLACAKCRRALPSGKGKINPKQLSEDEKAPCGEAWNKALGK
jgi:hypothetical protein